MSNTSDIVITMTPWLHLAKGDHLLFKTWTPLSNGAIAGACIGLVILALLERWLSAMRVVMEARWRHRALSLRDAKDKSHQEERTNRSSSASVDASQESAAKDRTSPSSSRANKRTTIAPFILKNDLTRGVMHSAQSLLGYIFMLAVMTFQAAYIISIVLGLGIGEVLFGRMGYIGVQ